MDEEPSPRKSRLSRRAHLIIVGTATRGTDQRMVSGKERKTYSWYLEKNCMSEAENNETSKLLKEIVASFAPIRTDPPSARVFEDESVCRRERGKHDCKQRSFAKALPDSLRRGHRENGGDARPSPC